MRSPNSEPEALGWGACFRNSFSPDTYHLFFADDWSACRRLTTGQLITPIFEDVPPAGSACRDCQTRIEQTPYRRRQRAQPELASVPLFLARGALASGHLPIRRLDP